MNEIRLYHEARAKKVIRNLEKRNMNGYYFNSPKDALVAISEMIKPGSLVGLGGSVSIIQMGLMEQLRGMNIRLLDRYKEGVSKEEIAAMRREGLLSDVFISSTNAITLDGKLVNQDGIGNRVAAMIYGPEKVFILAGTNKIVRDVEDGIRRIKEVAAPINSRRVGVDTPCSHTGVCNEKQCFPPAKICSQQVIIESSMIPDRIHVFLVEGDFGY